MNDSERLSRSTEICWLNRLGGGFEGFFYIIHFTAPLKHLRFTRNIRAEGRPLKEGHVDDVLKHSPHEPGEEQLHYKSRQLDVRIANIYLVIE